MKLKILVLLATVLAGVIIWNEPTTGPNSWYAIVFVATHAIVANVIIFGGLALLISSGYAIRK